jgi:membrane associated rhomboid family serine protease
MILPIINGILSFRKAPVTWMLLIINVLVFVFTQKNVEISQKVLEKSLDDVFFVSTQGYVYANMIKKNASLYSETVKELSRRSLASNDTTSNRLLGGLALRDSYFFKNALDTDVDGDKVAMNYWRKKFTNIVSVQQEHPSYLMGLTDEDLNLRSLITYQFAHGGVSHLVGNMIFFLFFACVLEQVIGGVALLAIYLLSGLMGALIYILMSDASAIPLIGASGAVSGIMGLFVFLFWRKNIRYLYFLFIPKRGFFGFIFLPAWVVLFVWGIHDLAGYLGTPNYLGGIAYSAHLGGELCGFLFGLCFYLLRKWRGLPMLPVQLPIDTANTFTRVY